MEYVKQAFERRGFQMQIVETTHSPVVLGESRAQAAARSLTFYAHYDGQPVSPSEWKDSAPFRPIFRDAALEQGGKVVQLPATGPLDRAWRIYGRSTTDDKGAIAALLAALDQLRASGAAATSTIRVILEGDEEAISPVLEQVVMSHPSQVRSDLVIMMDGPRHASGRPTFFFGTRGVIGG